MNPEQLHLANGSPTGAWWCTGCRVVHQNEALAIKCCAPDLCETCGIEAKKYRLRCDSCQLKYREARELIVYSRAKKILITEYSGYSVTDGDRYFTTVDELDDWLADHRAEYDEEYPGGEYTMPRVFACKLYQPSIDVSYAVERALEDSHEEALDEVPSSAIAELQTIVDVWCVEHLPVSYFEDTSRALILDEGTNE